MVFFTKLGQIISQFVWKYKCRECRGNSPPHIFKGIAEAILRKKNGTEGINFPDLRLYYKATAIKHMVLTQKQKYRSMEQNRKSRDKSTHLWTPYLWKRMQKYTMVKTQSLQQVLLVKLVSYIKRMKLQHFLTPYTKINSKCIKDLNLRPETIKLLRGEHGQNTLWKKLHQDPLWPHLPE